MSYVRPVLAMLFAALMLCFPQTALTAARGAMYTWATAVAPALFPYMALMPLLTSPPSAAFFERLAGRPARRLFRLSGAAVPAAAVSMTAGSPAGAAAAVGIASHGGLTRSECARIILCCGGFSPAFFVTGIGAAMLGSASDGRILMRAQLLTQCTMLLATRAVCPDAPLTAPAPRVPASPVPKAVQATLSVCGYMTLFSVLGALLTRNMKPLPAALVQSAMDLPSGARALTALPVPKNLKLMLLAAASGLGGLCAAAQNLAICVPAGISPKRYFAAKGLHAALMTAFTALQIRLFAPPAERICPIFEFSALISAQISLLILIFRKKNPFLNKENLHRTPENTSSAAPKTTIYSADTAFVNTISSGKTFLEKT